MRIAIIGGAGFVGINLYFLLKKKKIFLKIIDNLSVKKNYKYIDKEDFIRCDITNYLKLKKILNNFDVIINLAGQTGVLESNLKPNHCLKQNIMGYSNILNICSKMKNKITIINASTAGAIYGENNKICKEEEIKKPLSYYGLTKKFNEELSEMFNKLYKIKVINLRFSNIYGEFSAHKKSLIHTAINNSLNNKVTKIYGDGSQTRDFIYVQDLVKIIYKSIKLNHGSYNLASGRSKSVNFVLDKIRNISGNLKTKNLKKNKSEVKDVQISNNKIKKSLKINNQFYTDLEIGILKTFEWYKKFN